jgi:hypothetical protein
MAINLLHYSTGNDDPTWGIVRDNTVLPLPGQYATTANVLHQAANCQATSLNPARPTSSPSRPRTVQ